MSPAPGPGLPTGSTNRILCFPASVGSPRRHAMKRLFMCAGTLLLSIAGGLSAQQTQLLFVENSRGGDVSVIDDATMKIVGTIDIGLSPDDIVTAPDGKTLFLTRI